MQNYTILIIDYDPRSVEALREPLERAGFEVEVAADGLSGIRRFHQIHPDVTLIEAMLPKKHGFEVCQELKASAHGKSSAIFIVTSVYKGRRYRYQAKDQHGCDEFLEKPLTDEDLLAAVAKYVSLPEMTTDLPLEPDPDDAVLSVEAIDDDTPAAGFELSEPEEPAEPPLDSAATAEPIAATADLADSRRDSVFNLVGFEAGADRSDRGVSPERPHTPRFGRASTATAPARSPSPRTRTRTRTRRARENRPPVSKRRSAPAARHAVSHDRLMLWFAAVLLTILGALLAYVVLR